MVGLPTGFRTRTRSENCLPIIHDSAGASPGTTDSQHRRPRPRPSHATLLKCLLGVSLAMLVTYEFGAPGLFVPLQDALDLDFPSQPAEVALLGELPPGGKLPPGKRDEAQMTLGDVMKLYVDTAGDSDRRRLAGDDVSGEDEPEGVGDSVRILVGVTSACCSPRARARRDSVRRTWIKRTRALHPNVDIVFFLSQPENASVAAKALGPIAEELAEHGDIVIVRGPDTYMDLPNKTFRMLRFGHAHPTGYTHILKTDDDCYLRVSHLLKALRAGFHPIRDPASKWYVSEEQLPNSAVPFGVKYLAGWGYVLSRDLFTRIVHKTNLWAADPESAPAWYTLLAWEDVLIGMMLMDVVDLPEDHRGFRAAWRSCPAETVLRHLDVDAPALLDGLYAQEESGLWGARPVQCSSGKFLPGDYSGWKAWRDTLPFVERL
ncbi:UDP-GlcNAc:betaGal beta-1,3-N-acetylglucosaminyltransferase 6 [Auxenochlorella protothecoides]|uniref:Hexosyltransferase n=1 Tax=Auxenochlorella protothecoides TaxID=3075 RepID=A0A087SNZ5_AUXPR|nr:UDP-GlcNAc:betaGal beta-1,3-N-acetylglucosaminyltransferase 6 [Auxenochlorella protothecoides]KFM27449.1 UDP-GlcNAc:betaGal beta-1,3-N-acetylglucosaminyltransferase 6 [Auxenochlorella protothecoides]